jgi:hypothetical protein
MADVPQAPQGGKNPAVDQDEAIARAKWDAMQAQLPPHQRRTWDQAVDDEERRMYQKLRGAPRRRGGAR